MTEVQKSENVSEGESALQARLVPILLSIAKNARQSHTIALQHLRVSVGQDQLLLLLLRKQSLTERAAADALSVRPSTLSKMADHCVRHGWIAKSGQTDDQRLVLLSLTDDGVATARAAQGKLATFEADLNRLLDLNAHERVSLKKMVDVIDRRLHRIR